MMAKSPRRRDISRKQARKSAAATGNSTWVSVSSGSSAVVSAPTEEIARLDPAFTFTDCALRRPPTCSTIAGIFGSRIGMRKIAADGAANCYCGCAMTGSTFGDERQFDWRHRIALEAAIACQRADAQAITAIADAGKLLDRIDVDQHGGLCQRKFMAAPGPPARKRASSPCSAFDAGLLERAGSDVTEGRGFHNA